MATGARGSNIGLSLAYWEKQRLFISRLGKLISNVSFHSSRHQLGESLAVWKSVVPDSIAPVRHSTGAWRGCPAPPLRYQTASNKSLRLFVLVFTWGPLSSPPFTKHRPEMQCFINDLF
jgi:hypothetical protein